MPLKLGSILLTMLPSFSMNVFRFDIFFEHNGLGGCRPDIYSGNKDSV
jgi:hypothetical protein